MKILSGADKLHGKHNSIKNKHFQNSCKFVKNFFSYGGLQIPDLQLIISLLQFSGKLIPIPDTRLLLLCQFFFILL